MNNSKYTICSICLQILLDNKIKNNIHIKNCKKSDLIEIDLTKEIDNKNRYYLACECIFEYDIYNYIKHITYCIR